ncbi:uncharacterized protein TRIADDRAFT_60004 [Trichoplax adhaerens]|uniref:FH2 domain-containing protein n=1 Tax=Trichoplax adhaerens TaxID=10228 RepID=B3S717_TRIAD|nr:hypothetical protein TRIADDRAFT_60004 [Trichoplax adhaerens]EDV21489.1 hypothetical protein TRIADDRAFT_60004 [Trichoplax adhaerens]|eukprot:XP_002116089.1 hypothetical protein TRIADDRAFT_60004 [Trichoplax adhaerens]
MFDRMKKLFVELMEYFCLDSNKMSAEEYFGDMNVFLKNFENAHKDIMKWREAEEKQRRLKERAEKDKEKKRKKKEKDLSKVKTVINLDTADDQEGVLDGLMQALQTGSAFRDPTKPVRKREGKPGDRRLDEIRRNRTRGNVRSVVSPSQSLDLSDDDTPTKRLIGSPKGSRRKDVVDDVNRTPSPKTKQRHRKIGENMEIDAEKLLKRLEDL